MSNEIVPSKSFEERLKDRIKESFGDLLTDKELTELIQKGIDQILFVKRTVPDGGYRTKEIPPLIHELISAQLEPLMNKAIQSYISEHTNDILPYIQTVLENGAGFAVVKALQNVFSADFYKFSQDINSRLMNKGI